MTTKFVCPKCGGSTWGTVDADIMDIVACHSDTDGTPLSLRDGEPVNAARNRPCGWTGKRSECGLQHRSPLTSSQQLLLDLLGQSHPLRVRLRKAILKQSWQEGETFDEVMGAIGTWLAVLRTQWKLLS